MISVQEAFSILNNNIPCFSETDIPLLESLEYVLSKDISSPINMPPFRQSAMDGFALCLNNSLEYTIVGEIKAGDANKIELISGQAIKIFTGAAVPDSAQAVIQIEKTIVKGTQLFVDEVVEIGANIRPIGEQILTGELALKKGTVLNAASIGFLSGLGFASVKVFKKPSIGIVITGNELVRAGNQLNFGKIYESNSIMLQSALRANFFENNKLYDVNDNFLETKDTIQKAFSENDIVLVSGGISVGDYDFVARAMRELEIKTLFYKVNQKPGKPLFVGKKNNKIIFALPGNPAACLSCFYVYVLPTLSIISGKKSSYNPTKQIYLSDAYKVNNSRCQFLKAIIEENKATILPHQNSSMLNSFSIANGLVYLENGNYTLEKGSLVSVYRI